MTTYRTNYTYAAASTAFAPPVTPTDSFTITGSATSNIYIIKMGLSTTQNALGTNQWFLLKRSAANTGGTSAVVAAVPYDSNNPAGTATVRQYTVNPAALGASLGPIWSGWVNSPAVAGQGSGIEIDFMDMFGQPLTLLSTAEVLAWNFNGAALPAGLSVMAYAVWYESSKT
jgi:hypothetical protein